jgi:hypothetical protein
MQAAGIAAAQGIEMSSHLMPEVSAQLLCATPTAHWVEYVDWADAILQQPLESPMARCWCPIGRVVAFSGTSQAESLADDLNSCCP